MTLYSAPPTTCYICQSPWIVYILLAAILSQGKSSRDTGVLRPCLLCRCCTNPWLYQESRHILKDIHLLPGTVAQLLACLFVMQRVLIPIIHFLYPPTPKHVLWLILVDPCFAPCFNFPGLTTKNF